MWPNITEIQKAKDDKFFDLLSFFYFKCAIHLNDNFKITCRKAKMSTLKITFLHRFFDRFTTRSTKTLSLHKNIRRKNIKISISLKIWVKCRKNRLHWKKKNIDFQYQAKFAFLENPTFKNVNSPKHVR